MAKTKKTSAKRSDKIHHKKNGRHTKSPKIKHVVEAEIDAHQTKEVVSRIKQVRAAHKENAKHFIPCATKRSEKDECKMTRRSKKSYCSRKGNLNALCFWAGSLLSDGSELFNSEKAN